MKALSFWAWFIITFLQLAGGLACYLTLEGAVPLPPDPKTMLFIFTVGTLAAFIRVLNIARKY